MYKIPRIVAVCILILTQPLFSFAGKKPKFLNIHPGPVGFAEIPLPQAVTAPGEEPYVKRIVRYNNSAAAKRRQRRTRRTRIKLPVPTHIKYKESNLLVAPTYTMLAELFGFDGMSFDAKALFKMRRIWQEELAFEYKLKPLPKNKKPSSRYQDDDRIWVLEKVLIPGIEFLLENPQEIQTAQLMLEVHQQSRRYVQTPHGVSTYAKLGQLQSNKGVRYHPKFLMPAFAPNGLELQSGDDPQSSAFWHKTDIESFDTFQPFEQVTKYIKADLIRCSVEAQNCPGDVPDGAVLLDPKKWAMAEKRKKVKGYSGGYKIAAVKIESDEEGVNWLETDDEGKLDYTSLLKVKTDADEATAESLAGRITAALGYNVDATIAAYEGFCMNVAPFGKTLDIQCFQGGLIKPKVKKFKSIGIMGHGYLLDHHMRREIRALRIVHSFLQNWDLKDKQAKMFFHKKSGQLAFSLNDLGASFGRYSFKSLMLKKIDEKYRLFYKGSLCAIRKNEKIQTKDKNRNWEYNDQWFAHLQKGFDGFDLDAFRFLDPRDARWIVKRISKLSGEQFRRAAEGAQLEKILTQHRKNRKDEYFTEGAVEEFVHAMRCRRDSFMKAFDIPHDGVRVFPAEGCDQPTEWFIENCKK